MAQINFFDSNNLIYDEPEFSIRNYWDSLGNKIISGGAGSGYILIKPMEEFGIIRGTGSVVSGMKEGLWKGEYKGGTYEEKYEKGKFVSGTMVKDGKTKDYTMIEIPAEPLGGVAGMMKSIRSNLKYPISSKRKGIEGTVFTEFIVDVDGSVKDIKTIKGISEDCDAEARRIASLLKWKTGYQRGLPTKVKFVLPIQFLQH